MTAHELIKALQDLGEENLDKAIRHFDDGGYVPTKRVRIIKEIYADNTIEEVIGID